MASIGSNFKYFQPESIFDPNYNDWLLENLPRPADLARMAETWTAFPYKPLISVITPVYNPPAAYLRQAIESVMAQVYPNWELCLADDASTELHVRGILQEYVEKDARIKVVFREENGHISNCSNSALGLATGDFVALFDHDDLLTPDALYEVVLLLNQHPEADMIYSDEDKIDVDDKLREPYFKPDWSPDSFLSRMYTCHLGVYRRKLVTQIDGFRIGYEGSQDYDLVLRLTEKTDNIFHIAKILYHWRIHAISASGGGEAKPYTFIAAEKALTEALARRGETASVKPFANLIGAYIARYNIVQHSLVSIIVSAQTMSTLRRCLKAILVEGSYPHYEVIVVNNQLSKATLAAIFADFSAAVAVNRLSHLSFDLGTKIVSNLNKAVEQARGEFLLFLQDNVEPITHDWIDALVEQAQRSSIGCVSGLLLYPDGTIWYAGTLLGLGGIAGHLYPRLPSGSLENYGQVISINNYSAVTGACLMCKRKVFDQVQGFTEALSANYYDVDLCLKMGEKGLRHVFLPHVVLRYHESYSNQQLVNQQAQLKQEAHYMLQRWETLIRRDPHYNPNFSLKTSYALKVDSEQAADRRDFNQLAFQLYETQKSLKETQERLQTMRDRLARAKSETEQIREALKEAQQQINTMEAQKSQTICSWFNAKKC